MNRGLVKVYTAEGTIAPCRIVKHGTADGAAALAAAATDAIMGVSDTQITRDAGQRLDAVKSGIAAVELGGTVARGEPITSDANGKGVKAAPAAGANARIVGFAEVSGVSGDIIDVAISLGQIQG
ncbi:DUF2190 family protein [Fundidesulfovibrio putealis]|uniref:DUF2190 family protein n=1 Tax=Fundidesulfovibrio putealis TaxID=270496 RepID=UPI00041CB2CC|nr:DUF2190 family protein [Fundidesulfovibrio putealis]